MKNLFFTLLALVSSAAHAGVEDVYPSLSNPEETKCLQVNTLKDGAVAFQSCRIDAKGLCSVKCSVVGSSTGYTSYQIQRAIGMSEGEYSLLVDMFNSVGSYAHTGMKTGAGGGLAVGVLAAPESAGLSLIIGPLVGGTVGTVVGAVSGLVKGTVYHGLKYSPLDEAVVKDQTVFLSRFQTMDEFITELNFELNKLK